MDDQQLADLLTQLADRVGNGESVDIDSECAKHPEVAPELRELWGTVLIAEGVGSSAISTDRDKPGPAFHAELPFVCGDYEFLEELGRGGMGVVYRARQTSLGRQVAVKMILRGPLATPTEHNRFRAEAEATARLDHAGIVPVYEVGRLANQPYFSMKLVNGVTLAEHASSQPVAPHEAASIMSRVSRAIHFAHERGVLHRDLKPSNILIDEDGQPLVTDFGLAKHVTAAVDITRTGSIVGTPSYMSPEQGSVGQEELGAASDVYSLGAILYFLLTGQPPFAGATPLEVMLMLREQDVIPPRIVNPKVDRDLEMISLRCLQKPPHLRYPTAGALADDLDAYLRDEPIVARSGRFAEVFGRLFRETHHATVLENWGLLWMWHSLVLLVAGVLTNVLHELDFRARWYYIVVWIAGLGTWAAVFWWLRRRMGPVTFVERQIAHVWAASMIAIGLLFFVEITLNLPVLALSPVLGLIAGMVFVVKAGILSGTFYLQAAMMFVTAFAMAQFPQFGHSLFGFIAASCFFFPGLKYYRQRSRAED